MDTDDLFMISACDAAQRLAQGEITSQALIESCLARIAQIDDEVQAWAFIDPGFALEQARKADALRQTGHPLGPLHGLPVALKDIIDTKTMPCENGTALDAGRRPQRDAAIVSLLLQAGAILMGKTVTTELAFFCPGKTHNPHNSEHTPGGSSSGSAAAVAAYMVPLAIGSQTNGSMIRPASYCGVVGYKPTFGAISRHGALKLSPALDTLGVFARNIEDAALLGESLMRYDANDEAMRPNPWPNLSAICRTNPPVRPNLAFVKTPAWEHAGETTRDGFAELVSALGNACDEVELPDVFTRARDWHRALMSAQMARNLGPYVRRGRKQLSEILLAMLDEGRDVSAIAYQEALDGRDVLNAGLEAIFDRFDAVVTPAATGQAPRGLATTGDPVFSTLWTYCGVPALSLPLLEGGDGMPLGVQLIGRRGDDARLLRTARWLVHAIAEEGAEA